MELILINDTKLKIMLTEEDMVHYELDCNCANYDNTETRRAFWSILDEAKHRTGFDAASDRVFIQLYPSKEGGCEMYVTKVGLLCSAEDRKKFKCSSAGSASKHKKAHVFVFDSLHNMIAACRLIGSSKVPPSSDAWIDENGLCYLFLTPDDSIDNSYLYGIMNEFGKTAETDSLSSYIKEHGKTLCKKCAVETLSVF
ncbi:MAG: adaptor protein MecA [Clostridia bacterium]|nr:adaptor protein MecA [Clostridia bacterium]